MKVKVLRNTVASGKDIFEGSIVDISDKDARTLTNMGKVRPLTTADAAALKKAMKEETERVLKNLPEDNPKKDTTQYPSLPGSGPTTQGPDDSTDQTNNGGA